MARFLFVSWDGGGNVPPTIGLAQQLADRGHDVAFAVQELDAPNERLGVRSYRARLQERGFTVSLLERSTDSWLHHPPETRIITGVMACSGNLSDLRTAVSAAPTDVLVIDCLMFGALAAAEVAGIPTAVLMHSAPGPLVGPGGPMERLLQPAVNEVRAAAGRTPVTSLWEALSHFPVLCATLRELDPAASSAPPSFEYVGPIFERVPVSGWRSPWEADDPRPLVLVSFTSTSAWDQKSRIRRTLEGLEDGRFRVLVTTSQADVAGIEVPDNVRVARHVPHPEILPHVSVTVTHAGHSTLAASLAHGVPLVSLPNPVADQPPLAAQLQALGAGLALDGETASSGDIKDAVSEVASDPSYRAIARGLGRAIDTADGRATAAARLEGLST